MFKIGDWVQVRCAKDTNTIDYHVKANTNNISYVLGKIIFEAESSLYLEIHGPQGHSHDRMPTTKNVIKSPNTTQICLAKQNIELLVRKLQKDKCSVCHD